jgi:hypothetical protein
MADFKSYEGCYAAFFLISIFGLTIPRAVEMFLERYRKERPWVHDRLKAWNYDTWSGALWLGIRYAVLLCCVAIAQHIFNSMWPLLGMIFRKGAFLFLALICLVASLLTSVFSVHKEDSVQEIDRSRLTLNLCLCLALTYVAILNFSYRIYSYIPEEKGGGDYTGIGSQTIFFNEKYDKLLSATLIASNCQSKPVIILHKDANEIWAAIPFIKTLTVSNQSQTITNGPYQWREPGPENRPRLVFSIKREAVLSVTDISYTNPADCVVYQHM